MHNMNFGLAISGGIALLTTFLFGFSAVVLGVLGNFFGCLAITITKNSPSLKVKSSCQALLQPAARFIILTTLR